MVPIACLLIGLMAVLFGSATLYLTRCCEEPNETTSELKHMMIGSSMLSIFLCILAYTMF